MNSPFHFALIGCGNIATEHATQITRVGKLAAVVDIDLAKAKKMGDHYGVPFFENTSAMYATIHPIDIVVIATPNGLHAEQAIEAMKAGCHVLVEKPIALLTTDIDKMKAVAERTGKQIFSVMQNRFNPPVKLIHSLLQKQVLGKIEHVQVNCFWHRPVSYYTNSWHGTMALDGGTLFTQFSHFIDLLCWFFGPVKIAKGSFKNTRHKDLIEFEDEGKIQLEFESGVKACMDYSVNEPNANKEGSLTIFSSKGIVKAGGAYLNTFEFEIDDLALAANLKDQIDIISKVQYTPNDYGNYKGSMRNHCHVYNSLQNTLMNQAPYYTTVDEAKNTISLINLIYQAR
ncbi:Gfo/Idh/MocA family protein [Sediminibacterium sp.]|uniref:Gfo/Idh/MocA family protein n=1 Tax=Sediminibacterium sp. TaxID=1917865 RepID=UPI003F6F8F20